MLTLVNESAKSNFKSDDPTEGMGGLSASTAMDSEIEMLSRQSSRDIDVASEVGGDYNSCFYVPPPPKNVRRIYHNRKKTSYTDYVIEFDDKPRMTVVRLLAEEANPTAAMVSKVAFLEGSQEDSCLPMVLETPDVRGWVPLLIAVRQQQADAVEALLSLGADPNVEDPETGCTPLIIAVTNGDAACVRPLLDYGAIIDIFTGQDGRNPLCEAIFARRADLIDMLLEAGGSLEPVRLRYPSLVDTFEKFRSTASKAERLCANVWMPRYCSTLVGYTWHVTMPAITA
jgi:ankyrin repeat protein